MEPIGDSTAIFFVPKSSSENNILEAETIIANDVRDFLDQPWENWAAVLGRWSPLCSERLQKVCESDCTTLSFEDKRWAGEMPGIETFIAHVCRLCKAVVKPGFLTQHYALWHNVKTEDSVTSFEELEKDPLNTTLRIHRISPDCKLILGAPKVKIKRPKKEKPISNTQNSSCSSVTGILLSPKATHPTVSTLPLNKSVNRTFSIPSNIHQETVPNISVSLPLTLPSSVPIKPTVTPSCATAAKTSKLSISNIDVGVFVPILPAVRGSSKIDKSSVLTVVPVVTHVTTASQPLTSPPPKKRSKTERKYLPIKDREYNPDKHCGVWNLETKKHCTRSLTCNCHSLSQRRAVTGRSKTFDKLLADHRAAKETLPSTKANIIQVTQQEKRGKCSASISKPSSVRKKATPPTHNFHVVTSGPSVTSVISHQRPTVLSSLRFQVSSKPLVSVEVLESGIKSFTPAVISKVTIAKFPPYHSNLYKTSQVTEPVVKTKLEHLSADFWARRHPKPLRVCSFAAHKVGAILSHGKKMSVTRRILRTAVVHGLTDIQLSSNAHTSRVQANHSVANVSSKGELLGRNNMVLITNIASKSTKVPFSRSSSNNKAVQSLALTTVVPQITTVKTSSSSVSTSKNVQQYHVSTVLTPCSKQNELLQNKRKSQMARVKRKNSNHSSSVVEVVGSVLPKKTGVKSRGSHMPLMTLAIANGVSSSSSRNKKMGEQKVVFVSQSTAVPDGFFSNIPNVISSNITMLKDAATISTKLKGDVEWRHKK